MSNDYRQTSLTSEQKEKIRSELSEEQCEVFDQCVKEKRLPKDAASDLAGLKIFLNNIILLKHHDRNKSEREDNFYRPKHKLSAIHEATGVSKLKLRNWLTRGQLSLQADESHQKQGWRLFSDRDAIYIALIARLSELGVPISDCLEIADPIMDFIESICTKMQGRGYLPVFVITNNNGWDLDMRRRWLGEGAQEDDPLPAACIYIDPIEIMDSVMRGLGYDFQIVRPS